MFPLRPLSIELLSPPEILLAVQWFLNEVRRLLLHINVLEYILLIVLPQVASSHIMADPWILTPRLPLMQGTTGITKLAVL